MSCGVAASAPAAGLDAWDILLRREALQVVPAASINVSQCRKAMTVHGRHSTHKPTTCSSVVTTAAQVTESIAMTSDDELLERCQHVLSTPERWPGLRDRLLRALYRCYLADVTASPQTGPPPSRKPKRAFSARDAVQLREYFRKQQIMQDDHHFTISNDSATPRTADRRSVKRPVSSRPAVLAERPVNPVAAELLRSTARERPLEDGVRSCSSYLTTSSASTSFSCTSPGC